MNHKPGFVRKKVLTFLCTAICLK